MSLSSLMHRRTVRTAAIVLFLAAAALGAASRIAAVVAASEASLFRSDAPLGDVRPEQGAAFVASTGKVQLSSHVEPSSARVLEDGRPLGPGNALHDAIRQLGRGQYSFWHDYVYFSASDNTDPRTNGRTYTIDYPLVPAAAARTAGRAALALFVVAMAVTVAWLIARLGGGAMRSLRQVPQVLGSAGRLVQSVATLWVLTALLGIAASTVFLIRIGTFGWAWPEVAIGTIAPEQGAAFVASLGRNDLSSHEEPSAARVLEDGRPLGPGNSQHADVRQEGRGRYSFWHDYVVFSASDSSDPRTNGRRYSVSYPPVGDRVAQTLYALAALSVVCAFVAALLALAKRRDAFAAVARQGGAEVSARLLAAAGRASVLLRRQRPVLTWRSPAGLALLVLSWGAVGALIVADREVYLARTGESTRFWTSAPLQGFVAEEGHGFVAPTRRPDLSSHLGPSNARVLENGKALGPANAQHVDIRNSGQGRYSFWYDYVLFAASDNTDPRTNGRTYTITYSEIGPTEARLLFLLTAGALAVALFATAMAVRTNALGARPGRVLRSAWVHRVQVLIALGAAGLVLVPMMRAAGAPSTIVAVGWLAVFAVTLAGGWGAVRSGSRVSPRAVVLLLAALAGGEAILTAKAPHRWQGCTVAEPVAAWDAFCVAPDSASYYMGYRAGSQRNPLYPWFIEALTAGTGFDGSAYRDQAKSGALITRADDPLFPVVRAQIVLLMAASLALAAALMVALRMLVAPVILLALYDFGFFTAYELNIVLTEPLVQTWLFLIVAAFLLFLSRPRVVWLIGAAAACGFVYLTRQASAYTAVFLAVMVLWALAQDWRRWWLPSAAALGVLATLMAIPDLVTYASTGSLTRTQEGLQYQYRIAHALQYATLADVELMPDPGTKAWLTAAIPIRDREHRMVDEKYTTEYDRMTYYINQNLYWVAMPIRDPGWIDRLPMAAGNYPRVSAFFMAVATPILQKHWPAYLQFAAKFWHLGLTYSPVSRIQAGLVGAWAIYAVLWAAIFVLRDRHALAAATLIVAHWGHVALASMFAVPIPRMVWASEVLVLLAAALLCWRIGVLIAARRGVETAATVPASTVPASTAPASTVPAEEVTA